MKEGLSTVPPAMSSRRVPSLRASVTARHSKQHMEALGLSKDWPEAQIVRF